MLDQTCTCISHSHPFHEAARCDVKAQYIGGICLDCRFYEAPKGPVAYIAGPMTGYPQFNFPDFDAMAAKLRAQGWRVKSPAEMDDPESRAAAMASPDGAPGSGSSHGETWGDFLARDVKLIADDGIESIVVLKDWWRSRGARLETFVGYLCGLTILDSQDNLKPIPLVRLIMAWAGVNPLQLRRLVQEWRG